MENLSSHGCIQFQANITGFILVFSICNFLLHQWQTWFPTALISSLLWSAPLCVMPCSYCSVCDILLWSTPRTLLDALLTPARLWRPMTTAPWAFPFLFSRTLTPSPPRNPGSPQLLAWIVLLQDFISFSAHGPWSCLEEEEVDQTRSGGQQSKAYWVIAQSSQRGTGPERVTFGVSKPRGFYEQAGGLF